MALLKWLGETTVTFNEDVIGLVNPGDEFEVPDEKVERYTRRSDIVLAKPNNEKPASPAPSTTDA